MIEAISQGTHVPSQRFELNLSALQQAQPGFALPLDRSASVSLADGTWRLDSGGRSIALHGRHPDREADEATAGLLASSRSPVLVAVGIGAGHLLDSLERKGWPGRVLALEPEPATITALFERRDWRSWIQSDRLRILAGPEFTGAAECWRWFTDDVEPAVFVNRLFASVAADGVARARTVIQRMRSDAAGNAEARRTHGARYLLNTLRNLPAIASGTTADRLAGVAARRPAIVVGAGPSLDRAVPILRQLKERALIIAVDTALRPLLAAGVSPHVVVLVDPSSANARHLLDLPPCPDTCLVTEGSIDPYALAGFRDRTFFFAVSNHEPWPWLQQHGHQPGRLRAWGSVLTTALDLAIGMDANPIAFVGADLAYTEHRPYARGVTFEEDWYGRALWGKKIERQWLEVVTLRKEIVEEDVVSGEFILTAAHLQSFRDWIVERIAREPGRRFINATGAGTLSAAGMAQMQPAALPSILSGPADAKLGALVRRRLQPRNPAAVLSATRALVAAAERGVPAANAQLARWVDFAPNLTPQSLLESLRAAIGDSPAGTPTSDHRPTTVLTPVHPDATEMDWLRKAAWSLPRTAMPLPKERLRANADGVTIFRFRTAAARVICSALPLPEDSLAENGAPLRRVWNLGEVTPGTYAWNQDEIHFRATDASDPRWSGHAYSLLLPTPVAYLESLPLGEILEKRL